MSDKMFQRNWEIHSNIVISLCVCFLELLYLCKKKCSYQSTRRYRHFSFPLKLRKKLITLK